MGTAIGSYVRLDGKNIQVRQSCYDGWSTRAFTFDKEFAKKLGAEITRLANKKEVPVHWPPQEGDVWRSQHGDEYFVTGEKIYCAGYSQPLSNLSISVDNGTTFTLVHRKGNSLK